MVLQMRRRQAFQKLSEKPARPAFFAPAQMEHATRVYEATGMYIESSPPNFSKICSKCKKVFRRGLTMHMKYCKA